MEFLGGIEGMWWYFYLEPMTWVHGVHLGASNMDNTDVLFIPRCEAKRSSIDDYPKLRKI